MRAFPNKLGIPWKLCKKVNVGLSCEFRWNNKKGVNVIPRGVTSEKKKKKKACLEAGSLFKCKRGEEEKGGWERR